MNVYQRFRMNHCSPTSYLWVYPRPKRLHGFVPSCFLVSAVSLLFWAFFLPFTFTRTSLPSLLCLLCDDDRPGYWLLIMLGDGPAFLVETSSWGSLPAFALWCLLVVNLSPVSYLLVLSVPEVNLLHHLLHPLNGKLMFWQVNSLHHNFTHMSPPSVSKMCCYIISCLIYDKLYFVKTAASLKHIRTVLHPGDTLITPSFIICGHRIGKHFSLSFFFPNIYILQFW